MKKKFIYILNFVFVVCLSSDIYAAQEWRMGGKVLIGNSSFSWQAKGKRNFCEDMQKNFAVQEKMGQKDSFTIPLFTSNEATIQISADGKFSMPVGKRHVTVKDQFGRIALDTKINKQKQSLDEDGNQDNEVQLQLGSSVTLVFPDSSSKRKRSNNELLDEEGQAKGAKKLKRGSSVIRVSSGSSSKRKRSNNELLDEEGQEKGAKKLKRGSSVIRVSSGSSSKRKRSDDESLEEEGQEKGAKKLKRGSSVIRVSPDKLTVTYDKDIKLISKRDQSELTGLLSCWGDSQLVGIAIRSYGGERKGEKEVWLKETGEGIKALNNFLQFDKEGREKFLYGLSIAEHVSLVASLHEHGFIVLFGCNYFDFSMQSLKSKIRNLLEKVIKKDVFSWKNEMGWFEEIQAWSPETRNVMEDILRRIIRPIPKVVLEWTTADNIVEINFNSNGTRVCIKYEGDRWAIIDPENREPLFMADNVEWINLNSDGTRAVVVYKNDRWKIIDLADYNRDIVFTELTAEQLLFVFLLKKDSSKFDRKSSELNRILQSFCPEKWQKLKKLYFQQS